MYLFSILLWSWMCLYYASVFVFICQYWTKAWDLLVWNDKLHIPFPWASVWVSTWRSSVEFEMTDLILSPFHDTVSVWSKAYRWISNNRNLIFLFHEPVFVFLKAQSRENTESRVIMKLLILFSSSTQRSIDIFFLHASCCASKSLKQMKHKPIVTIHILSPFPVLCKSWSTQHFYKPVFLSSCRTNTGVSSRRL